MKEYDFEHLVDTFKVSIVDFKQESFCTVGSLFPSANGKMNLMSHISEEKTDGKNLRSFYITNEIRSCPMSQLSFNTFLRIDKEINQEAQSNVRSIDGNAEPILRCGESNVDIDDSGVFTDQSNEVVDQNQRTTRIRFRKQEISLLERWYRERE